MPDLVTLKQIQKPITMGLIEDKNKKKDRQRRRSSDDNPVSGEIGNRDIKHNEFDIDERTIKDQKNKK